MEAPPVRRCWCFLKSRELLFSVLLVVLACLGFATAILAQSLDVQITGPNGATTDDATITRDQAEFSFTTPNPNLELLYNCTLTGPDTTAGETMPCTPGTTLSYALPSEGEYAFIVAQSILAGTTSEPTQTRPFAFAAATTTGATFSDTTSQPGTTTPDGPATDQQSGGSPPLWPLAGLLGGLLLGGTATFFWRQHRFRIKLEFEAKDEEPQGRCQRTEGWKGWKCQKALAWEPSRRHITSLLVAATDQAGETLGTSFEGEVVEQLNDAVAKYRHAPDDIEELKLALLPVASGLVAGFDAWLRDHPGVSRQLVIKAQVVGGRVKATFTPFHCERGNWEPHRSWSRQLADERDEDVAVTAHPIGNFSAFVAHLASFVGRVDVQAERNPQAPAVPHV